MIPEIQTFIESKNNTKESFDSLNQLIQSVNNRDVSILMIVEDLSETLISTDPKIRAKGIELLIRVFCNCKKETITPKMASVILKFCLERLNDLHSLQSSLDGILYILQNFEINHEIIKETPKIMIDELIIPGYQQTVRQIIFKIYELLADKYLEDLRSIEDIFVPGFVQAVESEKDPRNIMVIFKIIKIIVDELNYKPYVEDIFELIFCYFPITFKAPPGNVIKITSEDLKDALKKCLISAPEFSKFAIPQLIEKLTSRLDNTKRDSLDVLIAGGNIYNFEDYADNLNSLTEILRDEAFDNAGESLEQDFINAITSFTNIYSRGGNEWVDKYIDEMTTKPISHIKDFGHPRGKFSRNIICAVIKENEYAFTKIINKIFPELMEKIKQPNPPSVQSFLMEYVRNILTIANLHNIKEDHMIYQYKDTLITSFYKLKENDDEENEFKKDMEITSIGGLYELANLKGFLTNEQIKEIIDEYNNKLLLDSREDIRKLCLKSLIGLSSTNSDLITSITLPLLYDRLKEDMVDSHYEWILQSTEDITVECKFYEDTISKLIDIYERGIEEKKSNEYLSRLLESIKNIIERGIQIDNDQELIVNCFPIFKDNILRILINYSKQQREELSTINYISIIFQIFMNILDENQIKKFNEEILKIFIDKKLPNIMDIDNTTEFDPLNENSPKSQTCLIDILITVTTNISQKIFDSTTSKKINEKYLNKLVKSVINTLNSYFSNLASKLIFIYCIRFNNEKKIQKNIKNWIEKDIYSIINSNMVFKETAIILFSWLCKVLYIKANENVTKYIMKLVNIIHDKNHASSCVNGLKIIFDKDVISEDSNKLYTVDKEFEENLINTLIEEIITIYKNSENNIYCIIALGLLLKLSDIRTVSNKDEIKPIMLYSLTLPNSEVLSSSIEFFSIYVSTLPSELKDDLITLIKYLISLTKAKNNPHNTIKVRVLSLKLLDIISKSYESYELLPIKQTVLNELDNALDDNKKYVRKMAVHCRNQWFTIIN
ncbi:ARM repeat-containing protein [Anaeromyces robustus]|uniref:MMS19 nucleotide excision repair protein n=1 Tax=Anaeromyces robustus TaxID=1754192 RepID=A0A1Y1XE61_9FUNG|nr:ARM repeat-containing protein [Anaeromyces robustus]|eukprot:ORX84015.1 ARM repeat-containing protein [Anaeromyces robustus]